MVRDPHHVKYSDASNTVSWPLMKMLKMWCNVSLFDVTLRYVCNRTLNRQIDALGSGTHTVGLVRFPQLDIPCYELLGYQVDLPYIWEILFKSMSESLSVFETIESIGLLVYEFLLGRTRKRIGQKAQWSPARKCPDVNRWHCVSYVVKVSAVTVFSTQRNREMSTFTFCFFRHTNKIFHCPSTSTDKVPYH